jgi:hypothetical protein
MVATVVWPAYYVFLLVDSVITDGAEASDDAARLRSPLALTIQVGVAMLRSAIIPDTKV